MKIFKGLTLGLGLFSGITYGADTSLTNKLDSLNIPSDRVSPIVSQDQIEAINGRYSSLNNRHELTFSSGNNFNSDSHIDTTQYAATYRYHLNSNWSFGFRYSQYNNELSDAGEKLFNDQRLLPDTDYAIKSTDAFVNYNTVYGKIRLGEKRVLYFDHYVSLGYGNVALGNGEATMYTADTGFSFWFGKNFSTRFGLKNELYYQQKINGKESVHNVMGYLEFGYLFGEGSARRLSL